MDVTWKRLIFILVVCAFAIWTPQYIALNSGINRSREGCERLNTVREQLYSTLNIAATLVNNNEQLTYQFRQEQDNLVNSVSEYADLNTDDPVDVNCVRAYAKPFPLSLSD